MVTTISVDVVLDESRGRYEARVALGAFTVKAAGNSEAEAVRRAVRHYREERDYRRATQKGAL